AGTYVVRAGEYASPPVHVGPDVYRGLADTLMTFMRQQRSGYNPFLRDSAHRRDGIIVDHPTRTGEFIPVSGGWADAADYLQYVATSATATYHLLAAWRDAPAAFADAYDARGLPGANGAPDVLDEARHGLDALGFAQGQPVPPWMGTATARHYQWYPWHNAGHYEAWARTSAAGHAQLAGYYRQGLERVERRATNGFRAGIPFIWCSNDLM